MTQDNLEVPKDTINAAESDGKGCNTNGLGLDSRRSNCNGVGVLLTADETGAVGDRLINVISDDVK